MKIEAKERLLVVPHFINERLPHKDLPRVGYPTLKRDWHLVGTIDDLKIYQKNDGRAFLGGFELPDDFIRCLHILVNPNAEPVQPPNLTKSLQVNFVTVSEDFAATGYAGSAYRFLVKRHSLISDQTHYKGGRELWESLAEDPQVYLYVYDGLYANDYLRDSKGQMIRYHKQSINPHNIWGDEKYAKVLLVAVDNPL